ncbi:gamma-glutamylcyclotransferase family protein [Streptomyces sp. NPDC005962]|uniref:gamma-glutamylcyclotransferase family protein n=1 Tax=Streptomyces sp. NPDC005962 TaxID=3154466 RepID=UPI0034016459
MYGTLQFEPVLQALLGRIPTSTPTTANGWRAAALPERVYPGLVPAAGATATGLLLEDLTSAEWGALDAFEDDRYDLRQVHLAEGRLGWAYLWPDNEVLPENWDAEVFVDRHLAAYAARCASIAEQRNASY